MEYVSHITLNAAAPHAKPPFVFRDLRPGIAGVIDYQEAVESMIACTQHR